MFSRFKKSFPIVLFVVALVYVLCDWRPLFVNPFTSEVKLRLAVVARLNERGDVAVMDNLGKRVVLVSGDGKVRGKIEQGVKRKAFQRITGIDLTDERLYLLDTAITRSGGAPVGGRILEYSLDGEYLRTLQEETYGDTADRTIMAYGLTAWQGRLYCVVRRQDHWAVSQLEEGQLKEHIVLEDTDASVNASWYFPEEDIWFLSYKDGRLVQLRPGSAPEVIPDVKFVTVMARDGTGRYYLTDSTGRHLLSMSSDGAIQVFQETAVHFVDACGDRLVTSSIQENCVHVHELSTGSESVLERLDYAPGYRIRSAIAWVCLAYVLGFGVWILRRTMRRRASCREDAKEGSDQPLHLFALYAQNAVTLGIAFVLVTVGLTVDFARQQQAERRKETRNIAWSISKLSPLAFGNLVKEVNGAEDYGKDAYNRMRYILDTLSQGEGDLGFDFSYILFRVLPDGRMMSVISPLERVYHTGKILNSEEEKSFRIHENLERLQSEPLVDNGDSDLFLAVVPIYDSEKQICALAYVGYNAGLQTQKILEHLRGQSLNLLTLFMLLLLVFGEVRLLWEFYGIRREKLRQGKAHETICEAHRPIRVLFYVLYTLTLSFLPTLCQESAKAAGLSGSFYATLPITIFFALSYIVAMIVQGFTQYFPRRAGVICGVIFALAYLGLFFFAFHKNYWMLFPFIVLCGSGIGVLLGICSNIVASGLKPRPRYRLLVFKFMEALIGGGIGLSAGAFVYENLGLQWVGILGVLLACLLIHLFREFIHADINVSRGTEEGQKGSGTEREALRFFLRPRMLSIAVCVALPVMALSSFESYVLPMYNTSLGNSVLLVGLAGLFIKFTSLLLSGTLFTRLQKVSHERRICICAGVSVAGAFIFGFSTSIVSILFLIFVASLSRPVLDTCKEEITIGGAREAGVNYNRTAKYFIIGETLADTFGPMVFLMLISMGYSFLGVVVASSLAVLLAVFVMVNHRRLKEYAREAGETR